MLKKEIKRQIIKEYGLHDKDTGSTAVQIALLNERIKNLSLHFRKHKKDHHSKRNYLILIHRRRKLLNYLKKNDFKKFQEVMKKLNV